MRIQKFLRDQLNISLRKADNFVISQFVIINNCKLVDPTYYLKKGDQVLLNINGQKKKLIFNLSKNNDQSSSHLYWLFYKPINVLCAHQDSFKRKLIFDYLPQINRNIYFAGRLDYRSRGLLILSTDGEFVNKIAHPRYNVTKEYLIQTQYAINLKKIAILANGFIYKNIKYNPFQYKVQNNNKHTINIILNEGKKREIRMILEAINNKVIDLLRIRIGKYTLKNLSEGHYHEFQPNKNSF